VRRGSPAREEAGAFAAAEGWGGASRRIRRGPHPWGQAAHRSSQDCGAKHATTCRMMVYIDTSPMSAGPDDALSTECLGHFFYNRDTNATKCEGGRSDRAPRGSPAGSGARPADRQQNALPRSRGRERASSVSAGMPPASAQQHSVHQQPTSFDVPQGQDISSACDRPQPAVGGRNGRAGRTRHAAGGRINLLGSQNRAGGAVPGPPGRLENPTRRVVWGARPLPHAGNLRS
jgi:hypothetical protein